MLLQILSALIERMGVRVAGILLIGVGIIEIIPASVLPEYITHGLAFIAVGGGLIAFGQKQQKAQKQFVTAEAEKRIASRDFPTASNDPAIQREINKQLAGPPLVTPPAEAFLAEDRKTPLNGTAVQRG